MTDAPSKFCESVPHLQRAWDSTSLGLLKECPKKYYYQMILGYQSRGTSIHLAFGIAYHKAQEIYHHNIADGVTHDEALKASLHYCLQFRDGPDPDPNKNRVTLVRSICWHLDTFRHDIDPLKTHILDNGKPACELSFRMEIGLDDPDGRPFLICGHLDRLASMNEAFYFIDYKTTKSALGDYYFSQYSPNNQMSLYFAAAKQVLKTPARGGYIDAAQLLVGGTRFARRPITRTKAQMDEWQRETIWWLYQAQRFAEEEYWPMNDKACGNYGGCPFQKVCSLDPALRMAELQASYEKFDWNPLEIRGDL